MGIMKNRMYLPLPPPKRLSPDLPLPIPLPPLLHTLHRRVPLLFLRQLFNRSLSL